MFKRFVGLFVCLLLCLSQASANFVINSYVFGTAATPFSLTETDDDFSATNASSYSFTSQAIGTADSTRYVVVGIGQRGAAAETITAVTIGGVSASSVVDSGAAGDNDVAAIWIAAVPTGTTATIGISLSGTVNNCEIVVWRLVGANPTATSTGSDASHASNALSDTLVIPSGGGGVGIVRAAGNGGTPRTWTWTNLTEGGADDTIEGGQTFSGALSTSAGSATRTATASGALVANSGALALAAWGP
jgi:hypothetical protein